jgi:hypothetical protein
VGEAAADIVYYSIHMSTIVEKSQARQDDEVTTSKRLACRPGAPMSGVTTPGAIV